MPLTDPKAIEIISHARRPNVAKPRATDRDFQRIFEDFFPRQLHESGFDGQLVMDLGPGQFDFARLISTYGGRCENIDNDPAVVELGVHLGCTCYALDLTTLEAGELRGRYDGVFCKFSINALWETDIAAPRRLAEQIDAMLAPGAWGWIAPWNGRSIPELRDDDDLVAELLTVQRTAFEQLGWTTYELTSEQASYYGVTGNVENHPLFLKNLNAPKGLTR